MHVRTFKGGLSEKLCKLLQRILIDKQKTFGMPLLFFPLWQLAYPDIPVADGIAMILEQ